VKLPERKIFTNKQVWEKQHIKILSILQVTFQIF